MKALPYGQSSPVAKEVPCSFFLSLSLSLLFYKIKKRNQRDRIHVIHTFMCFSMALLSIAPDFPAPASFFTVPEPEQKKRSATC